MLRADVLALAAFRATGGPVRRQVPVPFEAVEQLFVLAIKNFVIPGIHVFGDGNLFRTVVAVLAAGAEAFE